MIVFPSINETCADPQRGKGGPPPPKKKKKKKKTHNYNWSNFLKNTGTDPLENEKNVNFFSGPQPPYRKFLHMRCMERTHFKAQSHYLHAKFCFIISPRALLTNT